MARHSVPRKLQANIQHGPTRIQVIRLNKLNTTRKMGHTTRYAPSRHKACDCIICSGPERIAGHEQFPGTNRHTKTISMLKFTRTVTHSELCPKNDPDPSQHVFNQVDTACHRIRVMFMSSTRTITEFRSRFCHGRSRNPCHAHVLDTDHQMSIPNLFVTDYHGIRVVFM